MKRRNSCHQDCTHPLSPMRTAWLGYTGYALLACLSCVPCCAVPFTKIFCLPKHSTLGWVLTSSCCTSVHTAEEGLGSVESQERYNRSQDREEAMRDPSPTGPVASTRTATREVACDHRTSTTACLACCVTSVCCVKNCLILSIVFHQQPTSTTNRS